MTYGEMGKMEGPMISLKDAAKYLGCSVQGLHHIVNRSRDASNGAMVKGETIQFCQYTPGGSVRFKKEWLDDFIDRTTNTGQRPEAVVQPRRRKAVPKNSGFGLVPKDTIHFI
jgi:hypothetical protein